MKKLYFGLASLLIGLRAAAGPLPDWDGKLIRDVQYSQVDPDRCVFDILYPEKNVGEKKYPVHVYIHGGSWTGGTKDSWGAEKYNVVFRKMANKGFAGISVEYRLVKPNTGPFMETCVIDCKDALRFIVKSADDLNIDPDRIVIWGASAGGHLCAMVALTPDDMFLGDPELRGVHAPVVAAATWFGVVDIENTTAFAEQVYGVKKSLKRYVGARLEENPDLWKRLNPVTYASGSSVPVFLIHGLADTAIPYLHSQSLYNALQLAGVPSKLLLIENAEHGFRQSGESPIVPDYSIIVNKTVSFLTEPEDFLGNK
jgi:acetyl esterase/lipase